MNNHDITVIILTKNEEINIEKCINSVDWVKKIIVVDSGSNDKTVIKAEALGAETYINIQNGPFRIDSQRNWALDNIFIDTEWILFLDADEVIPTPLKFEIIKIIKDNDLIYDAYELTPRYLFWGTWLKRTQGFPNWHARFLRRGKARFAGGVWEHFALGVSVGRITEPYNHFANSKGLSDWISRHDRYSSWDAKKVFVFLKTGDPNDLFTTRKLKLRKLAARFWPLRPFARFFQMYFLRLGFLEGLSSLVFCSLYFFYELMIVIKIIEYKRMDSGKSL